MKRYCMVVLSAAMLAGAVNANGADRPDFGKAEYESNCALCHGRDLRGALNADFSKVAPPDISLLTKNNGGVFPFERVFTIIDGRQELKSHGTREMPIWGRDYQVKAAEHYVDVPYDPEVFVRSKIFALIDYLNRMQRK